MAIGLTMCGYRLDDGQKTGLRWWNKFQKIGPIFPPMVLATNLKTQIMQEIIKHGIDALPPFYVQNAKSFNVI